MASPGDRPDYTFMRSGLGEGPVDTAFAKRIISILFAMIAKAAETAALYTSHAERTVVAPADIRRALCYEAQKFLQRDGLESDVMQIEQDLYGSGSGSGSETETASETASETGSETETEPEPETEAWCPSACTCEVCAGLNETWATWAEWEPTDEAEKFLKSRIDAYIRKDEDA